MENTVESELAGREFVISRAIDRRNEIAFAVAAIVTYLAAPVFYIGMVQAALCSRLGGNASVANLPVAVSSLTGVVPLLAAWVIPYRRERSVVLWCALISAAALGLTGGVLAASFSNVLCIAAVIVCSMVVYVMSCVTQVYLYQCLSRGTTAAGRARTMMITFTLGPLSAVAGSLIAQALLDGRWLHLAFPFNFAAIYFLSVPCALLIAAAGSRQRVVEVPEEAKPRLGGYLLECFRAITRSRTLTFLCFAYALACAAVAGAPNLALYARGTVGKPPELLVGYIMAVRFSGKSIGGFLLGLTARRWNNKTVLVVIEVLIVLGCVWALAARGFWYFGCFALLGTGELAGAYFPNYCLSVSPVHAGARNLALLAIFASVAGAGAALHGALADAFGFPAGIGAMCILSLGALLLVRRLPSDAVSRPAETSN
jgi:hypothetical protein